MEKPLQRNPPPKSPQLPNSENTPPTSKIPTKKKRSKKSFTQMNPRTEASKISNTNPQSTSKRNKSALTRANIYKKKSNPTLILNSKIPGTGLFAYTNSGTRNSRPSSKGSKLLLPPMQTNDSFSDYPKSLGNNMSTVTNLTRDVEEKVENKLLTMMEEKVTGMTTELETLKIKNTALEIEFKKLKGEFEELQGFKELADNQIIRERELKRTFEKEVVRLKEESRSNKLYIQNLENKVKMLQGNLEGVSNDKEKGINKLSSETEILRAKLKHFEEAVEERDEVIEDLRYKIQTKEAIAQQVQDERVKAMQELKEKRINENEQKMYKITKLVGEISDLNQKLGESEYLRKKYIEKNKKYVEDNKGLKQIIEDLQNQLQKSKKDAKSIRLAKKNNNEILEKKILKLGDELKKKDLVIETLEREITDLKDCGGIGDGDRFDNFEEIAMMPVKAKPTLFGDFE